MKGYCIIYITCQLEISLDHLEKDLGPYLLVIL